MGKLSDSFQRINTIERGDIDKPDRNQDFDINFVILDGARGVGKSTTAQQVVGLLQKVGLDAIYFKKGPRNDNDEYANMRDHINSFRQKKPQIAIVDRFVATEIVMSLAHERVNPRILFGWAEGIERQLHMAGCLHYILTAPTWFLNKRISERGTRQLDMPEHLLTPLWNVSIGMLTTASQVEIKSDEDNSRLATRIAQKIIDSRWKQLLGQKQ